MKPPAPTYLSDRKITDQFEAFLQASGLTLVDFGSGRIKELSETRDAVFSAIAALRMIEKGSSDSFVGLTVAESLVLLGDLEGALSVLVFFSDEESYCKGSFQCYFDYPPFKAAILAAALNRHAEAMARLSQTQAEYPECVDHFEFFLGAVQHANGNFTVALEHYGKCIVGLHPRDKDNDDAKRQYTEQLVRVVQCMADAEFQEAYQGFTATDYRLGLVGGAFDPPRLSGFPAEEITEWVMRELNVV